MPGIIMGIVIDLMHLIIDLTISIYTLFPKVFLNIVKFCIKIGFVNVNTRSLALPNNGDTLLHSAAWCRCLEVVKFLIENGADVNAINSMNLTPLQYLVEDLFDDDEDDDKDYDDDDEEEILEIVKVLCKNGADVNAKNDQDHSPVEIALQYGDYRLLDHLIPFKASIPIWG